MRFWDSSALVPLCVREGGSENMQGLMKEDEEAVVWWATRVAACRRNGFGFSGVQDESTTRCKMKTETGD